MRKISIPSLCTLALCSCMGMMPWDVTITTTNVDLSTDTDDATVGIPTDPNQGPVCKVVPLYIVADDKTERPWVRAKYEHCSEDELIAEVGTWALHNVQTDSTSPGPMIPEIDLDPNINPYPDTLTDSCVVFMWGVQYKASEWQLLHNNLVTVDADLVDGYMPGSNNAAEWVDGWMATADIDLPRCHQPDDPTTGDTGGTTGNTTFDTGEK